MKGYGTIDDQAQGKQDDASADNIDGNGALRSSALEPLIERKHNRSADHEQKGGEDQVRRSPPAPCRMLKWMIGSSPVVVDHYHEGNGDAAGYIQR